MKKIKHFILIGTVLLLFGSCAEDIPGSELTVSFPSVILNGAALSTIQVGGAFEDPGVIATFGPEDIGESVVITGSVDPSTPGVYRLDYTASAVNELGEEGSSSATRQVLVGDLSAIGSVDLSGSWLGPGWSSNPSVQQVIQLAPGWYQIGDVLSSGNGIIANFVYTGSGIIIPDQPGPFGNVNTTAAGAEANFIDADTFNWIVFIGCCGNFGPINWSRQ